MPRYRYTCEEGHSQSLHRSMEDRDNPAPCMEDGCSLDAERDKMAEMQTQNPQEFEAYVDYNLKPNPVKITSRRQKKKLKREEGVREKGSYTE